VPSISTRTASSPSRLHSRSAAAGLIAHQRPKSSLVTGPDADRKARATDSSASSGSSSRHSGSQVSGRVKRTF
jgi:hypothetical protein